MQADQVSFSSTDNKAHAKGNVVVTSKTQQLYCDQLQLDRVVQEVVAEGMIGKGMAVPAALAESPRKR